MERIYLTKSEKEALHTLRSGNISQEVLQSYRRNLTALEGKMLAQCAWSEVHHHEDARLTAEGFGYLRHNPRLRNPVNWVKVAAKPSFHYCVFLLN